MTRIDRSEPHIATHKPLVIEGELIDRGYDGLELDQIDIASVVSKHFLSHQPLAYEPFSYGRVRITVELLDGEGQE